MNEKVAINQQPLKARTIKYNPKEIESKARLRKE